MCIFRITMDARINNLIAMCRKSINYTFEEELDLSHLPARVYLCVVKNGQATLTISKSVIQ